MPRQFLWGAGALLLACQARPGPSLPDALPFVVQRADRGVPVRPETTTAFTRNLTRFWATTRTFDWLRSISHGVHASTGLPAFSLFWEDVDAIKEGDRVTFRHRENGGGHNVYIPTSRLFVQAASAFLLTEDEAARALAADYARGIAAACGGLVHDAQDPLRFLMARNFAAQNHSFRTSDGREVAIDYSPWFTTYEQWNASRLHYPENPFWGDIWVTNTRSKDDVPHLYLAEALLAFVSASAEEGSLKDAAALADECLTGFARDIIDSGYKIRTKDAAGKPFLPTRDLASFVTYEELIPNAECSAKLGTALIAYGDPRGNDCGRAEGNAYEAIAMAGHYYNYAILHGFHIAAVWQSLLLGHDEVARSLVQGLVVRAERYANPRSGEAGFEHPRWAADRAAFLLLAAASGLPLTSDEVRAIQQAYGDTIDAYASFGRWDLWAPEVEDGSYDPIGGYAPAPGDKAVRIDELLWPLTYCFSPFKNPSGQAPIDCAIVRDRARWAE